MTKKTEPTVAFLKVGMEVRYRPCFGRGEPKVATVEGIELCDDGEKYGIELDKIPAMRISECTLTLDDGNWAYGTQVDEILG